MNFYRDKEIQVIFDISGGDIANEVLPYLDYDEIAKSDAVKSMKGVPVGGNIRCLLKLAGTEY